MLYICNSFSLDMLPDWRLASSSPATHISVQPVTAEQARAYIAQSEDDGHVIFSAVDRAAAARFFAVALGRDVPLNWARISLTASDRFLIGKYLGPSLPEGATELPPGARIAWLVVSVEEAQ